MAKKCTFISLVVLVALMLGGCYDMVDIEDIQSVAAICVDNGSIAYCTVSASPSEKEYSYDVYSIEGDNLYHGIDSISRQTGKVVSLSHLEAIMFSDDCSHQLVKENINALLSRTNSHPKAMAVYYEGAGKSFLEGISVSAKTGFAKHIRQVLENKYSKNTVCSAMELSYAMNFEGAGATVPVIGKDDDGNIIYTASVFTNSQDTMLLRKPVSDVLTALKNPGSGVYADIGQPVELKCTEYNISYNKSENRVDVNAGFEYNNVYNSEITDDDMGKMLNDGVNFILQQRLVGFDILDIYSRIKKSCISIPALEKHIYSAGGSAKAVQSVVVDATINVYKKGESK